MGNEKVHQLDSETKLTAYDSMGLRMKSRTNHKKLELHIKVTKNKSQEVNKNTNQKSWNPWGQRDGNGNRHLGLTSYPDNLQKENKNSLKISTQCTIMKKIMCRRYRNPNFINNITVQNIYEKN